MNAERHFTTRLCCHHPQYLQRPASNATIFAWLWLETWGWVENTSALLQRKSRKACCPERGGSPSVKGSIHAGRFSQSCVRVRREPRSRLRWSRCAGGEQLKEKRRKKKKKERACPLLKRGARSNSKRMHHVTAAHLGTFPKAPTGEPPQMWRLFAWQDVFHAQTIAEVINLLSKLTKREYIMSLCRILQSSQKLLRLWEFLNKN